MKVETKEKAADSSPPQKNNCQVAALQLNISIKNK
jgi:hypothetical protein